MSKEPDDSPDELRPDADVRRLNMTPIIIVTIVGVAIILLLVEGIAIRNARIGGGGGVGIDRKERAPDKNAAADLKKDAQKTGPIPETPEKPPRLNNQVDSGLVAAAPGMDHGEFPIGLQQSSKSDKEEMEAEKQANMRETALTAVTKVSTFDAVSERAQRSLSSSDLAQLNASTPAAGSRGPSSTPAGATSGSAVDSDPNLQARKETFAAMERSTGYLAALKQEPISKYEIKAGTIVPAIMVSGVNSDLPGEIIAQVSQNVYDSATGNYLLIPQGAKLVGTYDSHVAIGQERVQVAWTRLNYPDSSTLDLGNMPGSDQAGYGGFSDKVNNHLWRIFGDSLMLSVLSAGAQLSQPQTASSTGVPTASQTVAASIGQQFATTGAEVTKRNMQIQPTLEIRPGYRFNVMVTKDVILEPYVERQ